MTSLYIHIPFCKKKCNYCDFVSYAGKEELIEEYVEALILEFKSSPLSSPPPAENSFPSPSKMERGAESEGRGGARTIYFGGGTPTLLKPEHFEKILSAVHYPLSAEISIESNPGTANKEKLKALRDLGINRISIGAQSFNDKHLKSLGRIHDSKDIFRIYDDARSAGFDNINLDLIFALPNQTLDEWMEDLKTAINLNPNHLSTYNLQIEEDTLLWEMINNSNEYRVTSNEFSELPVSRYPLLVADEETDRAMYEFTIETLKANGYKHYEISNFAKPGYECKHNINYWKNGNYIGIGTGAHSHINGKRWANPDSIEDYLEARSSVTVTKPVSSFGHEVRYEQRISGIYTCLPAGTAGIETDKRETIFLGLRLLDGLPIDEFKGFEREVAELMNDGLLEQKNSNYRLTRKGLYLGNLVFEKFV
jgi:oxygen-independent coproporphyrinogen-3 oxidase